MKHNKQFKEAVEQTPDIANGYKVGLQALGASASKVVASHPQLLNGSVDIDSQTANKYHDANRKSTIAQRYSPWHTKLRMDSIRKRRYTARF